MSRFTVTIDDPKGVFAGSSVDALYQLLGDIEESEGKDCQVGVILVDEERLERVLTNLVKLTRPRALATFCNEWAKQLKRELDRA